MRLTIFNMKTKNYFTIKNCRICTGIDLYNFLDLGQIALPNEFIKKEDLKKEELRFPLRATYCTTCSLVQLNDIVSAEAMFKNYLYIPSSSQTRISHFKGIAEMTKVRFGLHESSLIVDIGSNDGSLLNCFKNLDMKVVGIDPAENLVKVAELNGIPTVLGYINRESVQKVTRKYGKASLVLATNVVAHIQDLYALMDSVCMLLKKDGVFITQFPYLMDLLEKNQFDTIYHEHLSYFSLKPLMHLAKNSKMEIFDIERNDLDGGSIRVFWRQKKDKSNVVHEKNLNDLLDLEGKVGLYDKKTYEAFSARVEKMKKDVVSFLKQLKKQKKHIVGYGAAAKGNILLNYFGINAKMLDYLVDSTPYKQGLYSPGAHIPIYEESRIYDTNPHYLLLLAWNFKDEIIAKNQQFKKNGGKFIVPNPKLEIV